MSSFFFLTHILNSTSRKEVLVVVTILQMILCVIILSNRLHNLDTYLRLLRSVTRYVTLSCPFVYINRTPGRSGMVALTVVIRSLSYTMENLLQLL